MTVMVAYKELTLQGSWISEKYKVLPDSPVSPLILMVRLTGHQKPWRRETACYFGDSLPVLKLSLRLVSGGRGVSKPGLQPGEPLTAATQ